MREERGERLRRTQPAHAGSSVRPLQNADRRERVSALRLLNPAGKNVLSVMRRRVAAQPERERERDHHGRVAAQIDRNGVVGAGRMALASERVRERGFAGAGSTTECHRALAEHHRAGVQHLLPGCLKHERENVPSVGVVEPVEPDVLLRDGLHPRLIELERADSNHVQPALVGMAVADHAPVNVVPLLRSASVTERNGGA